MEYDCSGSLARREISQPHSSSTPPPTMQRCSLLACSGVAGNMRVPTHPVPTLDTGQRSKDNPVIFIN